MKKLLATIISSSLVLTLLAPNFAYTQAAGMAGCVHYLESVFVDNLKLCYDSPRYQRYNVWATPDNKMAYHALLPYNSTIANKIKEQLQNISDSYDLDHDELGLPLTYKHDPLFHIALPAHDGYDNSTWINLYNQAGHTVNIDIANSTYPIVPWYEYADLCIYEALDSHIKGNYVSSIYLINKVIAMWDDYGLADRQFLNDNQTKYETYKLALLYLAKNRLGCGVLSFENQLIERIWKQQNATSGGIHTHYTQTGGFADSDTNVETTSLVVYAKIPLQLQNEQQWHDDPERLIIIALVVFVGIMLAAYTLRRVTLTSLRKRKND